MTQRHTFLVAVTFLAAMVFQSCGETIDVITYKTKDAPKEFELPDGSTVLLNANSQLVFNSPFKKELRQVTLNGEAYFDIKGAKEWPFQVSSTFGKATALGTAFAVRAYEKEALTKVSVRKGKVAYNDGIKKFQAMLGPEDAVLLDSKLRTVLQIEDENLNGLAWQRGYFVFQENALNTVMRDLGHHFNKELVINNEALTGCPYSGRIDAKQTLDAILKELQKQFEFEIKENEAGKIEIVEGGCILIGG